MYNFQTTLTVTTKNNTRKANITLLPQTQNHLIMLCMVFFIQLQWAVNFKVATAEPPPPFTYASFSLEYHSFAVVSTNLKPLKFSHYCNFPMFIAPFLWSLQK